MGICWADMGIWSEYFLKSPKRELVLGEKLWKIFIRPIPEKPENLAEYTQNQRLGDLSWADEAQQAICPMKSPENGFSDSRAVKWIKKASPGDGVSMNEGVLSGKQRSFQKEEPVMEIAGTLARLGNRILSIIAAIIILLMLLYGGYSPLGYGDGVPGSISLQ